MPTLQDITVTDAPPRPPPLAAPLPRPPLAVIRTVVALWAALCIALLFCGAMTRPITYDEDQYVVAGALTQTLIPYRDFAFLQPPLYPFVLAPVFELPPLLGQSNWYLLEARAVTFGLALGAGLLLWHLVRRLGAGRALSMVLLTACLSSPFLIAPLANARNDALPLFLLLAGLAVHLWAEARGNEDPRAAPPALVWTARLLTAILFGLCAEAKLSYLFAPAAIAVHALFSPARRLLPTAIGLAIAAAPALLLWQIAPEAVRFGVLDYHLTAPAAWYAAAGQGELLLPYARLLALADYASYGGNLTLAVLAAGLSLVAMARRRRWKRPGRMLLALTAGALLLALLPAPSWPMYYAALAPLLACCIAHLERVTTHLAGASRKTMLVAVAALPILPVLALQVLELPKLLERGQWVGFVAHRNAQALRDVLAAAGAPGGEIATLFPMLVIDANPVSAVFATGPFVFRSGDALAPGLAARLHALSPATLDAALDADPPAALYTGITRYAEEWPTPMDAPLAAYAERHHWPLLHVDALGGKLWVRPRP